MFPTGQLLTLARWLAAAALLLLALGVPRFFVLCSHGGDTLDLEFAHAPGSCCEAQDDGRAPTTPPPGGALAAAAHCEHVALTIEQTPAPRAPDVAAAVAPGFAAVSPLLAAHADATPRRDRRAPATGPPPDRQRLRQQASVRLQV